MASFSRCAGRSSCWDCVEATCNWFQDLNGTNLCLDPGNMLSLDDIMYAVVHPGKACPVESRGDPWYARLFVGATFTVFVFMFVMLYMLYTFRKEKAVRKASKKKAVRKDSKQKGVPGDENHVVEPKGEISVDIEAQLEPNAEVQSELELERIVEDQPSQPQLGRCSSCDEMESTQALDVDVKDESH